MNKKQIEWSIDNRIIVDNVLSAYAQDARFILEIGSGHSTVVFAKAVKSRDGKVWTMDKNGYEVPGEYKDQIVQLTGNSLSLPWDRCIDLLYLDGCHKPAHLLKELEKYARFVNPGGWILFDDSRWHDKPRLDFVINKFAMDNGLPWWYGSVEPDGTAVIPVTKRLGNVPVAAVTSGTDCDFCEDK